MKKLVTMLTLLLTFAVNGFADAKTVYLSAGPWADDGGHFAVWAWGGENPGQWIPMDYVEDEFAVYKATLPEGITGFQFARFYAATAVGDYAWEKGDVDNRPSHVTEDITLKDDVDLYKITAMGPMFRTAGGHSAMFEEAGKYSPAEWNWQDFTVTFATNKGWENVYAFVWANNNGANFDDRITTLEDGKISRPKGNGTKITATLKDGVYTYSFKAEAAPAMIRFSNGKSGAAKEQTDNLEFENGKLYVFNNPEYYLVGTMNDWAIAEPYKLEANPEAAGEYMITLTLAAGDEFKVKSDADVWYPGDDTPNYKVADAGSYTVYFRPDGTGGDDWFYNVIYVKANAAPAEGKTVYLSAGPWADDGGHFAVWAWGGENPGQWIPMDYVEDEFAVYKATLPEGITGFQFARFYAATAVGDYAWEKGDVDNRPSHVTEDITLKDDVDLYKITAMGPMFRTAGGHSAMFEEAGKYSPAEWNWQDFTVTFATNKGWENVYAFVWANNNGANFDDRITTLEDGKISRPKGNGTKITATLKDGVYTYSFKAEAAPAMIRFSNGKSGAAKEQTDNLEFENGKLYVFNNPEYYLVGTMNDWAIAEPYKLEANPEAAGEYMITLTLAAGDEFKVKSDADVWYPGDDTPNYKVADAGSYTVYFRPDGTGGDDWFYNVIYVASNTGITDVKAALNEGVAVYTLQGIRVNNVRKGDIYIFNGKKVVIK